MLMTLSKPDWLNTGQVIKIPRAVVEDKIDIKPLMIGTFLRQLKYDLFIGNGKSQLPIW
jgi:hypothetical protein